MATRKKADGKDKYQTGFCANKQCEGTKPKSHSGKPLKTCEFWETCPCSCHELITQMYQITGMDREPPEQSEEYLAWVRAERAQFVMPSVWDTDPVDGLSSFDGTDTLPDDEGPVAVPVRAGNGASGAAPQPVFAPTPTGRRARGQLEYDVLTVCTDFAANVFDWEICTPKAVSEEIGKRYAIEPPSTGAVNAVWDRWEKLDFAVQDKKPSRFIKFTGEHTVQHLELIKARVKREKKRGQAEAKRGSIRPRGR